MNPPRIALVFLATITVVQIAYYRPRLPASVASHFDLAGHADGWMARDAFLAWYGLAILMSVGIVLGIAWALRQLPESLINLPRREFWLAPERRESTLRDLRRELEWIAVGVAALFAALFFFTAEASVRGSHRIPPQALWGLLGALLGGVGLLVYRARSRFASARPA